MDSKPWEKNERIRRVVYVPIKIDDKLLDYQHKIKRARGKHESISDLILEMIVNHLKNQTEV